MALREGRDEVPVEVAPGGLPVQQDDRLPLALVDVVLLEAIPWGILKLERVLLASIVS